MSHFNIEQALEAHDIKGIIEAADNGDHAAQDFCFLHPPLFDLLDDDIREAIILGALRAGRVQIEYAAGDLKLTVPDVKKKLLHRLINKDQPEEKSMEAMEVQMQADIRQQQEKAHRKWLEYLQTMFDERWAVPGYMSSFLKKKKPEEVLKEVMDVANKKPQRREEAIQVEEASEIHREALVEEAVEETHDLTDSVDLKSRPPLRERNEPVPHHEETPVLTED